MLRHLKIIILVLVFSLLCFLLSFNLFMGLKVKGYKYLFRSTEPFDVVIKHALILDGSGENDRYRGDIAIRDGIIAAVGYVNPKNSPVYDAGGLTVLPAPVSLEKTGDTVEHLLSTSYPRYIAEEIYIIEGQYQGLSLGEIAETQGLTAGEAHKDLTEELGPQSKVLLIPFEYGEERAPDLTELLARLTGYRARYFGRTNYGMIKAGFEADINFIKTGEYPDARLLETLKKGVLPEPQIKLEKGRFVSQ